MPFIAMYDTLLCSVIYGYIVLYAKLSLQKRFGKSQDTKNTLKTINNSTPIFGSTDSETLGQFTVTQSDICMCI